MSLINFIQKLQKKPRYIRIQILWLSVFVCMLIIVSLWVLSLKGSLSIADEQTEEIGSLERVKEKMPSLKEALKASIGAFFEEDLEDGSEQLDKQIEADNQEAQDIQIREKEKIKPVKLPLRN